MQYTLRIGGYELEILVTGSERISSQWSSYVNSHMGAGGPSRPPDLRLELNLEPGWMNDDREKDVRFEERDGTVYRVLVDKVIASGIIERVDNGFEGRFRLNGDNSETIDGAVSLCLSFLCEESGNLLLHSSAVLKDGRAVLFSGPSGAGKTTIVEELSGSKNVLSVDKALIAFDPGGTATAHSTPFSDRDRSVSKADRAQLSGIFFIEQAYEHRILPMTSWEATRSILGQTIAFSRSALSVNRTMEAIGKLVDLDLSYKLRFKKDDGFWPLIDEALQERKGEK